MNTNMTGFRLFIKKTLRPCALDFFGSLSIERVKITFEESMNLLIFQRRTVGWVCVAIHLGSYASGTLIGI